jgi:hypothetical protein
MDTEPRDASQFTDVDRGILLDLAAAVSTVLREKEEAHARSNEMVRDSFQSPQLASFQPSHHLCTVLAPPLRGRWRR